MRLTPFVGSLAPGRFADVVLLSDVPSLKIEQVWADGAQVSEGERYIGAVPRIDWPDWATDTINIRRKVTAADFALKAAPGRATMNAAVIRPFHWHPDFYTMELPVRDGEVQRDPSQSITKFAIVDRFSGEAKISKMFWRGCGPATPETALACSVAHDKHNIWTVGSSDAAMAEAVNALVETHGGWALVREGKLVATVRFEVGGLMSCRPAEAARRRDAASLRGGAEGRMDVRTDLPSPLASWFSGTADVRDPHLRAVDLGSGRALRAGAGGVPQRADGGGARGGLVRG